MINQKQAIAQEKLVVIILVLLALFAIIIFSSQYFTKLSEKTKHDLCKASVIKSSLQSLIPSAFVDALQCETEFITVNEKNEESKKLQLAKALYNCKNQFTPPNKRLPLFKTDGFYCFVCSTIEFSDLQPIKDFTGFLATRSVDSERTYLAALSGISTEDAQRVLDEHPNELKQLNKEVLDTTKKYAVIYAYAQGFDWMDVLLHVAGQTTMGMVGAAGAGVGVVVGGGGALLMGLGVISGPVGWGIIGVSTVLTVGWEWATYQVSPEKIPEYASTTLLREFNADELKALGCTTRLGKQKY